MSTLKSFLTEQGARLQVFTSLPGEALLCALGVYLCLAAMLNGDYLAVALLFTIPLLPLGLYGAVRVLSWQGRFIEWAFVVLVVLQSATFRIRDIDEKSVDWQIAMKLACIAAMGILAMTALLRTRALVRALWRCAFWILFLSYFMMTSLFAVSPPMALIETSSNLFGFLFLCAIAVILGPRKLAFILVISCLILCVMSVLTYFFDPELGRLSDWVNRSFVVTHRLQGVLGTPNSAGATAAFGLLATLLFSPPTKARIFPFLIFVSPFAFCLIVSENRMALAALIGAYAFFNIARSGAAFKLAIGGFLVSCSVLAFALWGGNILARLARSGSADEILNGTGRTRIWSVVLDLWSAQPVFGYGAGSAKFILPHHPLLFKTAAHAHDLYLNIAFESGAVGLALFLLGLTSSFKYGIANRSLEMFSLMIFYLLYGITEPILGGVISFVPISFYAVAILLFFPLEDTLGSRAENFGHLISAPAKMAI